MRLREAYLREAAAEYEKRMSSYCRLKTIEVTGDSEIVSVLPLRAYKIALCIEGRQLSSEEFAEKIEDIFEFGEIRRIYLNFSDPWKKNKQAKRRLTHKRFLDRYKAVLKQGDYIWFKTDNKALFDFSLNSFAEENFKLENISLDLHNSKFEGNVMTEYEQRFSEQGMPIYRLEATYLGWEDNRKKES